MIDEESSAGRPKISSSQFLAKRKLHESESVINFFLQMTEINFSFSRQTKRFVSTSSCNFVRILIVSRLSCDLICEKSHDPLSSATFNLPAISFVS